MNSATRLAKIPIITSIAITTAKILGNLSFLLKKITIGLPIRATTAAIAKYANTDRMIYKKYKISSVPVIMPTARSIPLAITVDFIG